MKPTNQAESDSAQASASTNATTPRSSDRDPWFDNIKIIVLALVVAGHVIEAWIGASWLALVIYNIIYLFHMPAIVVLSGTFAVSILESGRHWSQAARFLMTYFLFQAVFVAWYSFLLGGLKGINFVSPVIALWFLPALAAWTLALPLLLRLPYVLPLSFVLAIGVGYQDSIGASFALSRMLVFLPFFLAGALLRPDGLRRALTLTRTRAAIGLAIVFAFMLTTIPQDLAKDLFLGRSGYQELGLSGALAGLWRGWFLILSAFAVTCFLALVPDRRLAITDWGKLTLQIYILHSVVIYSARLIGIIPKTPDPIGIITGITLWALCLWAFSRPGLARWTRPFLEWR